MGKIKVFVSYAKPDKKYAGEIKEYFEKYMGFELFVAHDDINPSDEWETMILSKIDESDILIPIISENYEKSCYANQEIGIAYEKGKSIIPLSIDGTNPKGFISKFQAYKCRVWNDEEKLKLTTGIYFLTIQHPKYIHLRERAMTFLIAALINSDSFLTTSIIVDLMKGVHVVEEFNEKHIEGIFEAIHSNQEVSGGDYVYPKLKRFLQESYGIKIDN